jgi:hypothetical protein
MQASAKNFRLSGRDRKTNNNNAKTKTMHKKLAQLVAARARRLAVVAGTLAVGVTSASAGAYDTAINSAISSMSADATTLFAGLVPIAGIIAVGAFVVRRLQRGVS